MVNVNGKPSLVTYNSCIGVSYSKHQYVALLRLHSKFKLSITISVTAHRTFVY